MNSGHSSVNLAAKRGVSVRLAAPEQPYIPKTKPYVHAKDIALKVYGEFADFLMEWQEERKKPIFRRKKDRPKVSLPEILEEIDRKVVEAFEAELKEVVGRIPDSVLEESVAGFKEVARKEFLANVAKFWPELREQVYELVPGLAPPAVNGEKLARLRELQAQVDQAVIKAEAALQEIIQCLDVVAAAAKEEHELLWGTQEQNNGRFKDLPGELVWQVKNRLAQWQGKQAGMVEKEKPLQGNRRRW